MARTSERLSTVKIESTANYNSRKIVAYIETEGGFTTLHISAKTHDDRVFMSALEIPNAVPKEHRPQFVRSAVARALREALHIAYADFEGAISKALGA